MSVKDGLYVVRWEDTTNIATWLTPQEVTEFAQGHRWICENVGFLVYEDDDCVVVAGRRANDEGSHSGLVERVPRRSIIKMTRLMEFES